MVAWLNAQEKTRPLSGNGRGRCRLPSCLDAISVIPIVSVTSAAFIIMHCFDATMIRNRSSRIIEKLSQSPPTALRYVKSVGHSGLDAVVLS
jgi:hypothetical protein